MSENVNGLANDDERAVSRTTSLNRCSEVNARFRPSISGHSESMTNDVEKRWRDPAVFRAAVRYAVLVIAVAGLALVVYAFTKEVTAAVLVPAVLFVGGLGAFIRTYQVWRAEGNVADLAGRGLVSVRVVPRHPSRRGFGAVMSCAVAGELSKASAARPLFGLGEVEQVSQRG